MPTPFSSGQVLDPFQPPTSAPVTSLVGTTFSVPAACEPCRVEAPFSVLIDGKLYRFVMRDKLLPEDPYLVAFKAAAYSLAQTEPYRGVPPARDVRDFLIKSTVTI